MIFDDFEHVSMKEATTIEPHLIQATMKRIQSIQTQTQSWNHRQFTSPSVVDAIRGVEREERAAW